MRLHPLVPIATFVGGVALIAAAVALGQGQVFLFLIFPGVVSNSPLALVGMLLVFLGFVLGFAGLAGREVAWPGPGEPNPGAPGPPTAPAEGSTRGRFGGIVMIGPIPIVFGSSARVTLTMLVVGLVITVVLVGLFVLGRW